jgi:hypothetical protein
VLSPPALASYLASEGISGKSRLCPCRVGLTKQCGLSLSLQGYIGHTCYRYISTFAIVYPKCLHLLLSTMTRKRKAEIEAEEQLFSWDAKKIQNSLVHKTHFQTIKESGIDVCTTISVRESKATGITINTVPPDAILLQESSPEDDEKKKKTQVCSMYSPCYVFH